jgi:hypothetical protein
VVSGSTNSFANGALWSSASTSYNPNGDYSKITTWLTANKNPNGVFGDWSHLTPVQRNTAKYLIFGFGWDTYSFLGGVRGNHIATTGENGVQVGGANLQQLANAATMAVNPAGSFTTNSFIERAEESTLHWNAVKQWEIANQWYQLALTVNPGGRIVFENYPIDWDYLQAFDVLIATTLGSDTASRTQAQMHYARDIENTIKMAQYVDNGIPVYDPTQPNLEQNEGRLSRAAALRYLDLAKFADEQTSRGLFTSNWHFLDTLQSGLYLQVVNGIVDEFNGLYAQTQPSA